MRRRSGDGGERQQDTTRRTAARRTARAAAAVAVAARHVAAGAAPTAEFDDGVASRSSSAKEADADSRSAEVVGLYLVRLTVVAEEDMGVRRRGSAQFSASAAGRAQRVAIWSASKDSLAGTSTPWRCAASGRRRLAVVPHAAAHAARAANGGCTTASSARPP